ncbi:MAG: 4-(cytidine 5'-diphospho)-2-C-methyl-D-erythritol kinase [Dehalococcoidaceae bacterium]|nr:4-(cytidine 5'-diphospho)-2-C-methyl-D-erythritol kinase [Dehalococcoidaceae bacterium]
MYSITAPAKINLALEVLGKRPDGYHEILSIIQTIKLADKIELEPAGKTVYTCLHPEWDSHKSLVRRAVELCMQQVGLNGGVHVRVEKNIPLSAGLGGESSAAAAVLLGLNELFGLDVPPGGLYSMAQQIGSDVPFFLTGGTALVSGRGEKVSPLPSLPHRWVVIVVPRTNVQDSKTATMFGRITPVNYTTGMATDAFVANLTLGRKNEQLKVFNVFEEVAFDVFEGLAGYIEQFKKAGAAHVHLAGAGPVLFSLEKEQSIARGIHHRALSHGMQAVLTETFDPGPRP